MEALKSEVDALKADQKAHDCANKAFMKRIRARLLDERSRGSKPSHRRYPVGMMYDWELNNQLHNKTHWGITTTS